MEGGERGEVVRTGRGGREGGKGGRKGGRQRYGRKCDEKSLNSPAAAAHHAVDTPRCGCELKDFRNLPLEKTVILENGDAQLQYC